MINKMYQWAEAVKAESFYIRQFPEYKHSKDKTKNLVYEVDYLFDAEVETVDFCTCKSEKHLLVENFRSQLPKGYLRKMYDEFFPKEDDLDCL